MKNALKVLSVCGSLLAVAGCACPGDARVSVRHSSVPTFGRQVSMHLPPTHVSHGQPSMTRTFDAPAPMHNPSNENSRRSSVVRTAFAPGSMSTPPQAASGECWSSVYFPPELKTVTERVCLKEPSERFEVSPAEYEWVEERVCVKPASKQFVVVPPKYETVSETLVLDTGHTDWVRADESRCRASSGQSPASDVFCVVNYPKVEKNVTAERLVQPASMREVEIPAEYQTVRKQRCVKPATSRRIEIPGEYETVEKTVEVSPGRWEWQRVNCDGQAVAQPFSNPRTNVRKTGYTPDNR